MIYTIYKSKDIWLFDMLKREIYKFMMICKLKKKKKEIRLTKSHTLLWPKSELNFKEENNKLFLQ